MNKSFFTLLTALFTFSVVASADNIANRKLQLTKENPIAHFQQSKNSGMLSFSGTRAAGQRRIADYEKKGEIKEAASFGTITGDDNAVWLYTMSTTESPTHPYSYGSATIKLYDSTNKLTTTVTISIPDSLNINAVEPFGNVSTKFYDTNSKTKEFTVYLHEVGPNYNSIGHFLVYNLDGTLVKQYDNLGNIIWFDATEKYDTYQRAIFVTAGQDSLGNTTTKMSIMKPASWNNKEPQEEHVFEVRDDLIEYSNGPCLNTYKIDGKPYYMLSYYEKPFVSGYDENYDMILCDSNNYIVEIYDKNYEKVSTFKVPVTHADDVYCSEYTCGLYSYNDLIKGYYTNDDNLNVVVTRMDVRLDTDDDTYPYAFLIYNQDGTLVNTIADNVISWKQLADIHGQGDQVGCIRLNIADAKETLDIIDVPSCQNAVTFESEVEGRKISSNYDRYPVDDDFAYVIGMGDAESNDSSEVISAIGWFNQDGTLDHYVRFNLGKEGEYFTPLIEGYTLDPSLVNTDAAHEYIYIAKQRNTKTDKIENVLVIADENGNEIQRYAGGDEKTLRLASIVDTDLGKPRLIVGYADNTLGSYDIDFYSLPFVKFNAGGEGTSESPYVITSAGDLKQISSNPSAHYVLGNDIDMFQIADAWTPISQFTGTLDGKGHAISNLYIDNDESYNGLFGYLVNEGSQVKNIKFTDPTIIVNSGNRYVGLIAGMTMHTDIDSIFVERLNIQGNGNAEVGGIAGQATYYTTLASCSIKDANINVPNCSTIGGIASDTRTSTSIDACLVSGRITAQNTLGGIVGTTGNGSTVKNCHVNATLNADNTVGGVVGAASRNEVSNNYVEGTVEATSVDMYGNASIGGIAGSLESLWTGTAKTIMSGNVVNLSSVVAPENAKAVHRIVGFTIADEQYEEDETHKTEKGLADNYAISTLSAASTKGATLADGADVETIDKSFLEGLGFKYGTTSTAPWTGDTTPSLYFENSVAITGDVNGDGIVDISDVNAVISIICGTTLAPEETLAADVNGDGTVDISDVNAVISIICGK